MAEDVNASIGIDIDASQAIAAVRQLSAEISAFHQLHSKKGAAVARSLADQTQNLTNLVNRTGSYRASMTTVASATQTFTNALEKNKLSMGENMRYAMGSMKPFSRMFKSEWEMVSKVARERVKDLQTQYIRLGRDANGAVQAIKIRPLTLDMDNLQTKTMLAAQRMQVLNKLVENGSTNLLNWGKNTQWAGRQLMVGFTIPLTMLGVASARTFMNMEKEIIKVQRVYGDFSTTMEETTKMTDSLKELSLEFTKWGVSVTDTLGLAAEAAATGAMGADLINQVTNATRLAVLGNVSQADALETTMSVTSAFGIATEDLADKINFLNAVENQSVTSIKDLTTAIPIAAPVVKQLGGSVEDLAFFLTAMKEGGIDAGEGANALKSGLASIINPSEKASEMLMGLGINLKGIVESNAGDVKSTVLEFASALDTLDPLTRAQAIEQLFGKFQFSRISTLFQNVIKEGTQAQRVLELSQSSTEQLAVLSQRELAKVEDSTTFKFEAAMQRFQASLAPVGEEFLKAVTPLLDFGTSLLEQFNKWDDGAKTFAVTFAAVLGGIGPVLLMAIGLVANGVANIIKLFQFFAKTMFGAGKSTGTLGTQTDYLTQNMSEAAAAASSLGQTHSNLTQIYTSEAAALKNLAAALETAAASQRKMVSAQPAVGRTRGPKKYMSGTASVPKYAEGVAMVPGPKGKGDVVPAMLSPGEAIIPTDMAKKYAPLIEGMIA
jgi:TP901 family phage tail tape measure protein